MEQFLGQRLGVDARDCEGEEIFDQLIIVEAARAALDQPLAQPRTVAAVANLAAVDAPVHAASFEAGPSDAH